MQKSTILGGARFASAAMALAVVGAASAASLQFDFSVPTTGTSFTAPVALSQFNPSLGVLQSVTFGLKNTMTSQISLSNQSTSSTNYLIGTVNGSFALKSANGSTTYTSSTLVNQAGSGVTVTGAYGAKPSSTAALFSSSYGGVYSPSVTDAGFALGTLTDPASFASFLGLGSLNFLYTATALGTTSGPNGASPANYAALYSSTASANGFVVYNYQPVPEPTSVAALGLGVLGLARRRKAVRK